MAISRTVKTESELEDLAIADTVRAFVSVQSRNWYRHKMNLLLPEVLRLADEARAEGHSPDVSALIQQVFATGRLPGLMGPDDE